ncbi:unnamed protein product, partial [Larinioides sclopetarius]
MLPKKRQLHYSPEKAGLIINAYAVLHNICIHYNLRHFSIESWKKTLHGVQYPMIIIQLACEGMPSPCETLCLHH